MYSSNELFQQSREGYFGVYFPSAETVRPEITYIILFLTRYNESINTDKNDNLYTSSQCLTRSVLVLFLTSQSIAGDVTIIRQLWHDHVNDDI